MATAIEHQFGRGGAGGPVLVSLSASGRGLAKLVGGGRELRTCQKERAKSSRVSTAIRTLSNPQRCLGARRRKRLRSAMQAEGHPGATPSAGTIIAATEFNSARSLLHARLLCSYPPQMKERGDWLKAGRCDCMRHKSLPWLLRFQPCQRVCLPFYHPTQTRIAINTTIPTTILLLTHYAGSSRPSVITSSLAAPAPPQTRRPSPTLSSTTLISTKLLSPVVRFKSAQLLTPPPR